MNIDITSELQAYLDASGKVVLELKTNPEKHSTIELKFSEIFRFQDTIIDNTVAMLEKIKNQKKAS